MKKIFGILLIIIALFSIVFGIKQISVAVTHNNDIERVESILSWLEIEDQSSSTGENDVTIKGDVKFIQVDEDYGEINGLYLDEDGFFFIYIDYDISLVSKKIVIYSFEFDYTDPNGGTNFNVEFVSLDDGGYYTGFTMENFQRMLLNLTSEDLTEILENEHVIITLGD